MELGRTSFMLTDFLLNFGRPYECQTIFILHPARAVRQATYEVQPKIKQNI